MVNSVFPQAPVKILGASIGEDQRILLGVAVALTVVLGLVYRYTRFGRATAAVQENRRAAAALGYSPDVIASANWVIGSALACGWPGSSWPRSPAFPSPTTRC